MQTDLGEVIFLPNCWQRFSQNLFQARILPSTFNKKLNNKIFYAYIIKSFTLQWSEEGFQKILQNSQKLVYSGTLL